MEWIRCRAAALSTAEREELQRLRKGVRQLRVERDSLGKAAAWFARQTARSRATVRFREGAPGPVPGRDALSRPPVSESGYHAWRRRRPSARTQRDAELLMLIAASHARSGATYGAPSVHEHLADAGHRVGRKRVARVMRAAGLVGVSNRTGPPGVKRSPRGTTGAGPGAARLHGADA
jgi:putative transposase